jgi:GTPase SAR1 family protein
LIEEKRRRHDVYIIGSVGAGKTLFLSSFLHDYHQSFVPLDRHGRISFDPPSGHADPARFLEHLRHAGDRESRIRSAGAIAPSETSPRGPSKAATIVFEVGLVALDRRAWPDWISSNRRKKDALRAYCSNASKSSAMHPNKKMDDDYKKSLEKGSLAPAWERVHSLHDMDIFDIPVTERAGATSGWPGLGWFTFEGAKTDVPLLRAERHRRLWLKSQGKIICSLQK